MLSLFKQGYAFPLRSIAAYIRISQKLHPGVSSSIFLGSHVSYFLVQILCIGDTWEFLHCLSKTCIGPLQEQLYSKYSCKLS